MKLLEEIPTFPTDAREVLGGKYGIETAEAFYAQAVNNPDGLKAALHLKTDEVRALTDMVVTFLPRDFVRRCQKPVRHPRGVLLK